ncbi:hypothetical protein D3C72_2495830 [compost metagenome]
MVYLMPDGVAFCLAQDETVSLALASALSRWGRCILALTLLAHDLTFCRLFFLSRCVLV